VAEAPVAETPVAPVAGEVVVLVLAAVVDGDDFRKLANC
jgi:hypothetical protein